MSIKQKDTMCLAPNGFKASPYLRGQVRGHLINPTTGEKRSAFHIKNVITYQATDIMAQVLGGNTVYAPGHMGFIYGANGTPAIIDPPVSRTQDFNTIGEELADPAVVGNMQISPLALTPTFALDGDSEIYDSNSVVFTAQSSSGSGGVYGYPTGGSTYAGVLVDGNFFYHATLLTRVVIGNNTEYLTFARVSLKDTLFLEKPAGFELALFWQVSFF